MKHLYNRFQNLNTLQVFKVAPEQVHTPDPIPTTRQNVDPQAAAAALGAKQPPINFTGFLRNLPGSSDAAALADDIEGLLKADKKSAALRSALNNFSKTDFNDPNNPNLFSMFRELLKNFGIDLEDTDDDTASSPGSLTGKAPSSGPDGTPMAPLPNGEMPELDEAPSAEGMALLRERARDADVENLTNPAKNIAIATLKAHPGLSVTSGFRGPERNARAGGAPNSDHLTGNAIDFGTTDPAVQRWIEAAFPGQVWADIHGSGGSGPANHLHVSYRPGGNRIT